jgi:hypothetical protein
VIEASRKLISFRDDKTIVEISDDDIDPFDSQHFLKGTEHSLGGTDTFWVATL